MYNRLVRPCPHLKDFRVCCCEQVAPDPVHVRPPDAAAFVRDLDDHVLVVLPVGYDDSDRWHLFHAVSLHGCSHAVFQQLSIGPQKGTELVNDKINDASPTMYYYLEQHVADV